MHSQQQQQQQQQQQPRQQQQQFDPFAASPQAQSSSSPWASLNSTAQQVQYLQAQGFPTGMIQMLTNKTFQDRYPLRIWILDNGSNMQVRGDAHILRADYTYASVSRWQELFDDCIRYHADLNVKLGLPTRVALWNAPTTTTTTTTTTNQASSPPPPPQYMSLYQSASPTTTMAQQDRAAFLQWLDHVGHHCTPHGPAPLLPQLRLLRDYIVSIAPQLQARHQTVPILIGTQGLLTDERTGQSSPTLGHELAQLLQSFAHLPVSFVLRLTTDDERAFEFYNALDARLSSSSAGSSWPTTVQLDVLDDFYGEALEVYLRNPWLCYAIVLHRFREMGYAAPTTAFDTTGAQQQKKGENDDDDNFLDVLDERTLNLSELRHLMQFLFGTAGHVWPDPCQDWSGFVQAVQGAMAREKPHWNPVLKTVTPWINIGLLHSIYSPLAAAAAAAAAQRRQAPQPQQQQQHPSYASPFGAFPQPQYQQQHQNYHQQQHQQQHQQSPFTTQNQYRPAPTGQSSVPKHHNPAPESPPQYRQQQQPQQQSTQTTAAKTKPQTAAELKSALDQQWAKAIVGGPNQPQQQQLKPIGILLGTLHTTRDLLPSPRHPHLEKWHPLSPDALAGNDPNVLKKAVRKVRLWLHPDKLPSSELSELEKVWCRTLWDTISEAWDNFQESSQHGKQ